MWGLPAHEGHDRGRTGSRSPATQQSAAPLHLGVRQKKAEAADLCDADLMPVNPVLTSKAGFKGNL